MILVFNHFFMKHIQQFQELFDRNQAWAENRVKQDPLFFERLAQGQSPRFLWIGCSDSRIPPNEATGTEPGEIFIHRNIANMVVHTDMSMLSVLDYAVNVLKVEHIIVCGHYGCGGVLAAMGNKQVGLIDNWLRHIKDVYRLHHDELENIEDLDERGKRLVELNVEEQVYNLCKTSIIQNMWASGRKVQVHGIVYDLQTGILQNLNITNAGIQNMENVFVFDMAANK